MTSDEAYAWTIVIRSLAKLILRCFGMIAANQVYIKEGKVPVYTQDWFDEKTLLPTLNLDHKTLIDILDPRSK